LSEYLFFPKKTKMQVKKENIFIIFWPDKDQPSFYVFP